MKSFCMRWMGYVAVGVLLQACAPAEIMDVATEEQRRQVETTRTFGKNYDAVWAAVTKTIAQFGNSVQSQDKTTGNISTDWVVIKEAVSVFTTGRRARSTVFIERLSATSTKVSVKVVFEERPSSNSNWFPAGRKSDQLDIEKRFFDAVQKNL